MSDFFQTVPIPTTAGLQVQLPNNNIGIKALTIDNGQSACTVNAYINQQSASGSPDFQIAPYSARTLSIGGATTIYLKFVGGVSGSCYVHACDSYLSSTANSVPQQPVSLVPFAMRGGFPGAMTALSTWYNLGVVNFAPIVGTSLYLTDVIVRGLDLARADLWLGLSGNVGGSFSQFAIFREDVDHTFATPLTTNVVSTTQTNLWVQSTRGTPPFDVSCILTGYFK